MKKILIALTLTLLASPAFAVCGDVDESNSVTAADALRVLQASVGIDSGMVCDTEVCEAAFTNLRYYNQLACTSSSTGLSLGQLVTTSTADLSTFIEWETMTNSYSDYLGVDEELGPTWFYVLGDCGSIQFDGSVTLPKDRYIVVVSNHDGENFRLQFFDEGPVGGRASETEELIGELTGFFVEGN